MKYTIELVNNRPLCRVATLDNRLYTIEGYELFQLLKEIEDDIEKFTRKDTQKSIFLRNQKRNEVILFKNIEELEKPLYDLYTKCAKKEIRDKKITEIKTKAAITIIASGIITTVLASKLNTNIKNIERQEKIETTTESIFTPNKKNTNELTVNDTKVIIPEIEKVNIEPKVNEVTHVNTQHVEPVEETIKKNEPIEISVNANYDKGINDRVEKYMPDIIERANKWGISPSIMRDLVSQEWGGNDTNLMHVVKSSWLDFVINAYNYESNRVESFVITDNPKNYYGKVDHIITGTDLKNPKTNLSAGAIILQYSLAQFDYNIPLGIQAYNNGIGAVNKIIKETERQTGLTKEQILRDNNPVWLKYTNVIEQGDENYFSNVVKHVDDEQIESKLNDVYSIKYIEDGEQKTNEVQFKLR